MVKHSFTVTVKVEEECFQDPDAANLIDYECDEALNDLRKEMRKWRRKVLEEHGQA